MDQYDQYRSAYSRIIDNIAKEKGKERADLIPWKDYDPIWVDMEAHAIAKGGGVHYRGD